MFLLKLFFIILTCCCALFNTSVIHGNIGQMLEVTMPRLLVQEFSYMPGLEGYRYSYTLANGDRRDEIGFVLDPDVPDADLHTINDVLPTERDDFRPKKNRKLSPGSLKTAAG